MAEIEVHYDKGTATLVVWFGDPDQEVNADHTDSDVIIMLDKEGRPLGIEVLGYEPGEGPLKVAFDQVDTSIRRARASA